MMKPALVRVTVLVVPALTVLLSAPTAAFPCEPDGLKTEYLVNPLGIDTRRPRLSWTLQSSRRGERQTAYRILVASSPDKLTHDLADVWDSGRVESDQSVHVPYGGRPLESRMRCWWKVRVWGRAGDMSAWSAPALWTMGLLDESDWQARWIGYADTSYYAKRNEEPDRLTFEGASWIWFPDAAPGENPPAGTRYFRRVFDLPDAPVRSARLLLTVDSRYVLFVNGQEVRRGRVHRNSWKRGYEVDVGRLLVPGRNVVAIEAVSAGGRPAGVIAKLTVESDRGGLELTTDTSWKTSDREVPGWSGIECDDTAWSNAMLVGEIGIQPWGNHWQGWAQKAPSPLLRRAFHLEKEVSSAFVFVCGLGSYELRLNGRKVGDHVLDPAFTRYDKRTLYSTYDVTHQVRKGDNAIGIMLGNGWYNVENLEEFGYADAPWRDGPKAIVHLHVTFTDGTSETLGSDESWRAATGPVVHDSIRNGEVYDAREEKDGWDTAGYDDACWAAACRAPPPRGTLRAQMLAPIRVTQTLAPVKLTEPRPQVFVFDLGQNIAGWARLRVSGPAGAKVRLRYAERLTEDGMLTYGGQYPVDWLVYQGPFQTDDYILKGGGDESWEPRFSYHGFRYVEVTGFPGTPTLDSISGRVVHTDFPSAGSFSCSHPMLNRIQEMMRWSYRGNFHGYPTDCPTREKNGWTDDGHLFIETALLNFDNAAGYAKWVNDFRDERRPDGQIAAVIPTSGWGYGWGPVADSAGILVPWHLYLYQGDTRVLAENFDQMTLCIDSISAKAKDAIADGVLDDWFVPDVKTPKPVLNTAFYFTDAQVMAKSAAILGRVAEAEKYAALADRIRQAFNSRFMAADGTCAGGGQTAQSCALFHELVPETGREAVVGRLIDAVEKQNFHVDVGYIGIKYLFPALSRANRDDLAFRIATQTTPPGWGDWIDRGATTMWETWQGDVPRGSSHNHAIFGNIGSWFFKSVAGINVDEKQPGFKHIVIHPRPAGDITWATAHHDSIRGRVESSWKLENGTLKLDVAVPANSTATVSVPTVDAGTVTESGMPVTRVEDVTFLRMEGGHAVFAVGSGRYRFEARRPATDTLPKP